jgi:mono/diheme cytochrome c family protein
MTIRTVSALALAAAIAACTPAANTDVTAVPNAGDIAAAPSAPDLAAPASDAGPASANTPGGLSSTPASAAPSAAPPAAPAVAPAPAPQTPAGASKAELETGAAVYARTCAMCHGPDGKGVPNMGAALISKDVAAIKEKVAQGTIKAGDKMPPMGAALSAEELDGVAKYVAAGLPK